MEYELYLKSSFKIMRLFVLSIAFMLFNFMARSGNTLSLSYLTIENNLSNNHITSILEDRLGYLWFGTSDGLNKWDGYKMEIFRYDNNNTNSIPNNYITCLAEDQNHNIWIGSNQGGIARYNYIENKFYRYTIDLDGNTDTYTRDLFVDEHSTIWAATDLGLLRYQTQNDRFENVFLTRENKVCDAYKILKLSSNRLLIQASIGLYEYVFSEKRVVPSRYNDIFNNSSIANGNISIGITHDGYFWLGTLDGLISFSPTGEMIDRYRPSNKKGSISTSIFSSIYEDSRHNLWIGTENGGINLLNRENGEFTVFQIGLPDGYHLTDNTITTIYEDSYQNVWFGTLQGGLNIINLKKKLFTRYEYQSTNDNSLYSNRIGAMFEDANGNIWVGSSNGCLHCFKQPDESFDRFLLPNRAMKASIIGIVDINSDNLLVAGWNTGLYQFNIKQRKFTEIQDHGEATKDLDYKNIRGIGKDSQGNFWLASHRSKGLTVYNPAKRTFYNKDFPGSLNAKILAAPYAVSMVEDLKKRIWIIAYTGIYLFDGEYHEFKSTNDTNTLSSNYHYTLFQASNSTIWIGNSNGLDKLIEEKGTFRFERCSQKYKLPANIKAIAEDTHGNLWLSSNEGITMFNPNSGKHQTYYIGRELPILSFIEQSLLRSSTGEMYCGSTNGLFEFHPDSLAKINLGCKIYISDFQLFNQSQKPGEKNSPLKKSISETKHITLNHNQSMLSFEYEALDIGNSGRITYACFMEGVDKDWNFVGDKRFATYTNMAPGEYKFRVKPIFGNELQGTIEANIGITIEAPFWRTIWAYILYGLSLLAALFFLNRIILNREKLKNELKIEKLKIQNVMEADLMKIRFFTNISHEFRTPLTLIKTPIEKLIDDDKTLDGEGRMYHYKLIENSTNKLLKMITQLLDFRKLEAGGLHLDLSQGDLVEACRKSWNDFRYLASQKEIEYNFYTNVDSLFVAFDSDKMDKIITNLLSNALKNTANGGQISLTLTKTQKSSLNNFTESIKISIKDTGIGIPNDDLPYIFERYYRVSKENTKKIEGTGIGLTLVKELTELHKGEIEVASEEGVGTEFVITLPFIDGSISYQLSDHHSSELIDNALDNKPENKLPVILLVEDEEELRTFVKREFQNEYHIAEAVDGIDGWEKVISDFPNLVISDVMMPNSDGIELCGKIKSNEKTSHIPVILLTANQTKEKELEGLKIGADAYVVKPFNTKVLRAQIENLLRMRIDLINKFQQGLSLNFNESSIDSRDNKLIQQIINLIVENISEERINADFISKHVHVSRSVVYVKIEALTGQTVNEFIRNIRLKKAVQLIQQSDMAITEVSSAVGFSSHSYFSKSFKAQFGCPPKEYIQRKKSSS
jgi:signal transduction histidine kinase/ligand-binding sensor domain-containing protein/DNA-binding response OmpR family regulator